MFCPNCGNQLDSNNVNCGRCGIIISHSSQQKTYQKNTNNFQQYKNKIIMMVLALVVLIGAFLSISYFLKRDKSEQEAITYFDVKKPIRIKENNLYGYIDSNGKKIVDPKFQYAGEFYDNYAIVKLSKNNEGNEYYALIDKKGNTVLNTTSTYSSSINYISEYDVWEIESKLYDKNLKLKVSETTNIDYLANGYFSFSDNSTKEVGIMNASGKKTYTYPTNGSYVYLSADISEKEYVDLKDDYCVININNEKYGIINCKTGKIVYNFSEKYISENDNNIFEIKNKNDFLLIEKIYIEDDKIVYRNNNNVRLEYIGNHILEIRDADYKYTYYDVKNNKNIDIKPNLDDVEDIWEILTNFKVIHCDEGGYGIKKDDQMIVPCGWDSIDYISDPLYTYVESKGKQLILVKKDDKRSLYDIKSKKVISTFNTSYISGNYGRSIFIYYKDADTKKTVVYNIINGKQQEFDEGVTISNSSNYFTVKKENKNEYYNTDFKLIYTGGVS